MKYLIAAFTILIGGCSFKQPYPHQWDDIKPHSDCSWFSGQYSNTGLMATAAGTEVWWLSNILFPHKAINDPHIDLFHVTPSESGYILEAFNTTNLSPPLFSQRLALTCDQGTLISDKLTQFTGHEQGNLGLGAQQLQFRMFESENAGLQIQHSESFAGTMLLIFPVLAKASRWYHFPKWEQEK